MRNFGLSRRESVGGNQIPGARTGAYSTRANLNVIQLATALPPDADRLNSRGFGSELFIQDDQPVIEPYELGSGAFFSGFLISVGILLLVLYAICDLLIA